jgi:hypothetical protein
LAGIDRSPFNFVIAPDFFDKYKLSNSIPVGRRPMEVAYSEPL